MAFHAENGNGTQRMSCADKVQSEQITAHIQNQVLISTTSLGDVSDGSDSADLLSEDSVEWRTNQMEDQRAFDEESSSMDTSMAFRKIRYLKPTFGDKGETFLESDTGSMTPRQGDEDGSNVYISIPPLNLNQVGNWSANDLTYTQRKGDDKSSKEMIRKTEAFKEWLSAKIESEKYTRSRNREAEYRLDMARAQNERQRMIAREQKLREWLERKQQDTKAQIELLKQRQQLEEVPKPNDTQESIKNYNAWLEKKLCYERAVRVEQQRAVEQRAEMERMKREHASEHFEKWLEQSINKPKPVPLNQGLLTLKGSISKMYVNPKPWVFDTNHYPQDASTL